MPWTLAGLAVFLMAGPRVLPQAGRTTLALALVPVRASASWADRLVTRARGGAPAGDLEKERDYFREKTLQLHDKATALEERLRAVSGAREIFPDRELKLLPASVVVNADSTVWRRVIVIARGSSHGVRKGQLVLWERHLVGRVIETGPWTARVQLLSDPAFRMGGVVVPRQHDGGGTLAARDTGVYEGCGDSGGALKWLSGETTAEEGAVVVTTPDPAAGVPSGLILGRIRGIVRDRGPYPRAELVPFVNPRALESVVVVVDGP